MMQDVHAMVGKTYAGIIVAMLQAEGTFLLY